MIKQQMFLFASCDVLSADDANVTFLCRNFFFYCTVKRFSQNYTSFSLWFLSLIFVSCIRLLMLIVPENSHCLLTLIHANSFILYLSTFLMQCLLHHALTTSHFFSLFLMPFFFWHCMLIPSVDILCFRSSVHQAYT